MGKALEKKRRKRRQSHNFMSMIVGIARIKLHLGDNHSLKGKRKVIKSIMNQVSSRFNCAVSEVAYHDVWQSAEIGIATVGNHGPTINSALDKIIAFVERNVQAEIVDSSLELIHLGNAT